MADGEYVSGKECTIQAVRGQGQLLAEHGQGQYACEHARMRGYDV